MQRPFRATTKDGSNMNFVIEMDAAMRNAFAKKQIPLWVAPSEVDSSMLYKRWSFQIAVELREWFARKWSYAFAAGYLGLKEPEVKRGDVFRMLHKMGYSDGRARELTEWLVTGVPALYKKGLSRRKFF
jgi:hypothetical protein